MPFKIQDFIQNYIEHLKHAFSPCYGWKFLQFYSNFSQRTVYWYFKHMVVTLKTAFNKIKIFFLFRCSLLNWCGALAKLGIKVASLAFSAQKEWIRPLCVSEKAKFIVKVISVQRHWMRKIIWKYWELCNFVVRLLKLNSFLYLKKPQN